MKGLPSQSMHRPPRNASMHLNSVLSSNSIDSALERSLASLSPVKREPESAPVGAGEKQRLLTEATRVLVKTKQRIKSLVFAAKQQGKQLHNY